MWGNKSPLRELLSPVLGIIERLLGNFESLLRITKPAEGIKKNDQKKQVIFSPLLVSFVCLCYSRVKLLVHCNVTNSFNFFFFES